MARGLSKKEAAIQLAIIAAEMRLAFQGEEDAPTWADQIDLIADDLDPDFEREQDDV